MAVVYRAEDAVLGRTVALKTLRRSFADEPSFRHRFVREARAMGSLDHENIIKVYDISRDSAVPFIVAECVEGKDVGALLAQYRSGRLGEQFTRRLAVQLLRALSYAHRRGIIHCDVKPSNVLVTPDGTVKVADFGIARIVEEDEAEEPGEVVGSARYMSPEQLAGGRITPASDIYSVGILLYHCLTGRPPFSGDLESLVESHLYEVPTSPRRLNKKISLGMEAVILKALAKDPAERYHSAREMLNGLEIQVPQTAGETRRFRPRRRRLRALLATTVGALLLGGTLVGGAEYFDFLEVRADLPGRAESVQRNQPPQAPVPPEQVSEDVSRENGAAAELVQVPDVETYFDYWARETLVNDGFEVEIVYDYQAGYANRGVTWATEPAMGSMAPEGSKVTVYATPKDLPQT